MRIEFEASLPAIQSAIMLDGMGDGGRVKLDISRQYANELLQLQQLAGQSFKVIIESDNQAEKSKTEDTDGMDIFKEQG